jgi:hypothetical protein
MMYTSKASAKIHYTAAVALKMSAEKTYHRIYKLFRLPVLARKKSNKGACPLGRTKGAIRSE